MKRLALSFLILICASGLLRADDRPNILIILTDDQGRADYSHYGTQDIQTPNIDRLFIEGMDFKNFRANSAVCSPTRAALLSGRYPDRAGVPGVVRDHNPQESWGHLAPSVTLLPKVLSAVGYDTAMIGKWHLGTRSPNLPNERGFDYFHGFLGDMMNDYWTHDRSGFNYMRRNEEVIDPEGHATDVFTQWACDFLESRRDDDAPFFLYLAYNAPHDPIQPPAEWVQRVQQREPGIADTRAGLVALIEHMDAGIGKVLHALDDAGLTDNTIVFFTSDNGGARPHHAHNGPYRAGKSTMYDGGLRVPAAVRWPRGVEAGSANSWNLATMDFFATACEAAGAAPVEDTDAVSFFDALSGGGAPPDRDLYFVRRANSNEGGQAVYALIHDGWKIVQNSPFESFELYNLTKDPKETTDLADSQLEKLAELRTRLAQHVREGGRVPWSPPPVEEHQ